MDSIIQIVSLKVKEIRNEGGYFRCLIRTKSQKAVLKRVLSKGRSYMVAPFIWSVYIPSRHTLTTPLHRLPELETDWPLGPDVFFVLFFFLPCDRCHCHCRVPIWAKSIYTPTKQPSVRKILQKPSLRSVSPECHKKTLTLNFDPMFSPVSLGFETLLRGNNEVTEADGNR